MRQQAMKAHPDSEAPGHPPQKDCQSKGFPTPHEERRNSAHVKKQQPKGRGPIDAGFFVFDDCLVKHDDSPFQNSKSYAANYDEGAGSIVARYEWTECNSYVSDISDTKVKESLEGKSSSQKKKQ
jgi:hypothetical protein